MPGSERVLHRKNKQETHKDVKACNYNHIHHKTILICYRTPDLMLTLNAALKLHRELSRAPSLKAGEQSHMDHKECVK